MQEEREMRRSKKGGRGNIAWERRIVGWDRVKRDQVILGNRERGKKGGFVISHAKRSKHPDAILELGVAGNLQRLGD